MKKFSYVLVVFLFFAMMAHAQSGLLSGAKNALSSIKSGNAGKGLSSDDIVAGLKEALSKGTEKSTGKLSAVDGFFKDA
ncbi:MAG TPA: DUF4197 family protein, partial [Puia sp.]